METLIMAIAINPRTKAAPKVQEILTEYGCIIKTRLGLHEATDTTCSSRGLILLQLRNDDSEVAKLRNALESIEGVTVNTMTI